MRSRERSGARGTKEAGGSRLDEEALVRIAWTRCRPTSYSSDAAEDCAQAARIALWSVREKMAGLSELASNAFGLTCARRAILRQLRDERRELPMAELKEAEVPLWHSEWNVAHCEGLLSEMERSDVLDALRLLRPLDYEIIQAAFSGSESDPEIAAILGLTAATVRQRRHRALARMRQILGISASVHIRACRC